MPAPDTPILENFGTIGGPPMPGWTDLLSGIKSIAGGVGQANVSSSLSYYSAGGPYGNNVEGYVDIATKPGTNGTISVFMLQDMTSIATVDGYEGRLTVVSGASNDTWRIYKIDNGAAGGSPLATATQEAANGDGLWLENKNGILNLYRRSSGVWALMCTATDTTYTGSKYLGLGMSDTVGRADNFGGGIIPRANRAKLAQTPFPIRQLMI